MKRVLFLAITYGVVHPYALPIAGQDTFARAILSKQEIVVQEAVTLTIKVYSKENIEKLDGKIPELNDFFVEEIPLSLRESYKKEYINGQEYNSLIWKEYLLFPYKSGSLQIPRLTLETTVIIKNTITDPFDAFFNEGKGYQEIKKCVQTSSVDLKVKPHSERIPGFSNGVGKYSISAHADSAHVFVGNPVSILVTVSGCGNMTMMNYPEVSFPASFDIYDGHTISKVHPTSSGLVGSMIYEYTAVPKKKGEFDIPPIQFVYYDVDSAKIVTHRADGFHISVERLPEHKSATFDDIRDIRTGQKWNMTNYFWGTMRYWLSLLGIALIVLGVFFLLRRRARMKSDVEGQRVRKAKSEAVGRLEKAKKLMLSNRREEFFVELLQVLWGYVGDRYRIKRSHLTHENVINALKTQQVDNNAIKKLMDCIDYCEYVRYAPDDDTDSDMAECLHKVVEAIETCK